MGAPAVPSREARAASLALSRSRDPLPRGVLIAIGLALLALVAAVAWHKIVVRGAGEPDAPAVASRLVRFDDGPGGSVLAIDGGSGAEITRFEGEQGFVRGTLRALVRDRKALGAGPEMPFELVLHADNRLTLTDPVTRQRIDLASFGPTNAGLFARLLDARPAGTPR